MIGSVLFFLASAKMFRKIVASRIHSHHSNGGYEPTVENSRSGSMMIQVMTVDTGLRR